MCSIGTPMPPLAPLRRNCQAKVQGGPSKCSLRFRGGAGCFASLPVGRRERYLESARIMPLLMGGGQPPTDLKAQDLARISIPVTVAFGEQTRPLFEVASRAVARAIPRASLKTVADAHHMLPETAPDRFAALVRQWLQE